MGSRLGRRVVHFANLPIKLQMPSTLTNIREIALRTIPSASKIEIKRVLESLYGFEVDKVRTLNMEGKKKQRGGVLVARPDYKKAYVTLKSPLSISPDWFPTRFVEEERERTSKTKKAAVVDDGKKHWLDEHKEAKTGYGPPLRGGIGSGRGSGGRYGRGSGSGGRRGGEVTGEKAKFPWSSMRNGASASSSSSSSSSSSR